MGRAPGSVVLLKGIESKQWNSFLNSTTDVSTPEEARQECDRCKGKGRIVFPSTGGPDEKTCGKCQGDGYIDWIQNITGGKPEAEQSPYTMTSSAPGTWKVNLPPAVQIGNQSSLTIECDGKAIHLKSANSLTTWKKKFKFLWDADIWIGRVPTLKTIVAFNGLLWLISMIK